MHLGSGAYLAEYTRTEYNEGALFRHMHGALVLGCCSAPIGSALACYLVHCCCDAMPCPLTPGDPTGQRSSP